MTAKTFGKTATVSCGYRDDCTRFWCTLMVAVKQAYRKTSISPPWRSIFQPFLYSGVQLEVGALFSD